MNVRHQYTMQMQKLSLKNISDNDEEHKKLTYSKFSPFMYKNTIINFALKSYVHKNLN